MKRFFLLCSLLAIGISSCEPDGPEVIVNCDFDMEAMRANYADNIIIPRLQEWHVSTQLLAGMAEGFAANPNLGDLNELRIMCFASYKTYQSVSTFAMGPGVIEGLAFREYVNTFPTNATLVDSYVAAGNVDAALNPNSIVGYPALEYLAFGAIGATDEEVLAQFTAGDAAANNRKAYLISLAQRIRAIAQAQVDGWAAYRSTFVNSTGSSEGSALALLVNELNFDMENMKSFKYKIPLGKFNGGVVLPEQVEGYYSGGSVALTIEHFNAMRDVYLGVDKNETDGPGLHDYLLCLQTGADTDGLLADAIFDKFQDMEDAITLLQDPLSEQLVNDKPTVEAAYTQMQMMTPLLKREMPAAFGVQISYQDNDGD